MNLLIFKNNELRSKKFEIFFGVNKRAAFRMPIGRFASNRVEFYSGNIFITKHALASAPITAKHSKDQIDLKKTQKKHIFPIFGGQVPLMGSKYPVFSRTNQRR